MAVTISDVISDEVAGTMSEESVEDICARLRSKYNSERVSNDVSASMDTESDFIQHRPLVDLSQPQLTSAATVSNFDVRCCPKCEGSKEIKEEYNFRVITKECDDCDGEGTLLFDSTGKRVRPTPMDESCTPGNGIVKDRNSIMERKKERRQKKQKMVEERIEKLKSSLRQYDDEIASTRQQLDNETVTVDIGQASELINQIQKHRDNIKELINQQHQLLIGIIQS